MSPDQAFAAYAGTRLETPSPGAAGKMPKSRSAALLAAPGRMFKGLRGSKSSASIARRDGEGPFGDEAAGSASSSEEGRGEK